MICSYLSDVNLMLLGEVLNNFKEVHIVRFVTTKIL